jgi:hypothetical protein
LTLAVTVVAGVLVLTWVVAAIAMAGRGLAVSDESFYLLSYRWWNVDLRSYTGAQYLYGPVFEVLDFSVRGLRLFRVGTVVVAHGLFGWSFMTWLRLQRPTAGRSRAWELAGVLVLVASGGIVYGWLPQSPGYNDVATLGSLLAAAAVLRSLRRAQIDRVLPVLPALAVGPVVVGMSLAKWSSAVLTFGFLAVVLVLGVRSLRARGRLRYVGAVIASTLASALFVDVVIMPFRRSLPPMIEVNRLVASGSNSPVSLLRLYLTDGLTMAGDAVLIALMAVAVGALGWVAARRDHRLLGGVLAVAGPPVALLATWPATLGVPGGGSERLDAYPVALVALAFAVAAASLAHAGMRWVGRDQDPGRQGVAPDALAMPSPGRRPAVPLLVGIMLLLLPPTGAMGTGNPLQYLAVNQFACWVALLVMAVTALPAGGVLAWFAGTSTACAVLICSTTGANGVLVHPYRSSNFETSTTPIGGDSAVAPVLVSRGEAEFYGRLRAVLGDEVRPGRPMMSFAGGSGVILALGGRSVGEGWYPTRDWDRSAAGIRAACAHGNPWPRDLQPVIIYGRPNDRRDRAALGTCGLHFRTDYRLVGTVQGPHGPLELYVPDVHHRLPRR